MPHRRQGLKQIFAYVLAASVLCCGHVLAQSAPAGKTPDNKNRLQSVEQKLEQARERQQRLRSELEALESEAASISEKLVSLASRALNREASITSAEKQIAILDAREKRLAKSLHDKRNAMAELLVGLQRLERNPPPPLAVHPKDALAAIRSATLFGAIVPALKAQSASLRQALLQLQNTRAALRHKRQQLKQHTTQLASTQAELTALLERKREIVKKTRAGLAEEKKRASMLAAQAKDLRQLIARLKKQREMREKEELRKSRQAAASKIRRRVRLFKPPVAFSKSRGAILLPAKGRKLRKYNETVNSGVKSKGLFIATRPEARIIAPAAGVVEYAGKFRSYGQLIILNVGEGYHILLAGLGKIDVQYGQRVLAGEPVGRMDSKPSRGTLIAAAMESSSPVLYIEFRKDNGTVDPAPWWRDNLAEAQ